MTTLAEASGATTATQPQVQQDQLTTGQIVAILAAGLAAQQTLSLLTRLLNPLGISSAAVRVAFTVGGRRSRLPRSDASGYRTPRGTTPLRPRGVPGRTGAGSPTVLHPDRSPALSAALAGEDVWRAAYVYSAAQRTQRAVDQRPAGQSQAEALRQAAVREQRFFEQHQAAQARRRQVAAQVDVAALRHGVPFIDAATGTVTRLVGWYARNDAKTSVECKLADGNNFPANRPPSIGWPGAVHPHCRCKPGAPHANGRLLDSVIRTRRAA